MIKNQQSGLAPLYKLMVFQDKEPAIGARWMAALKEGL
jgi:hypothetical protein